MKRAITNLKVLTKQCAHYNLWCVVHTANTAKHFKWGNSHTLYLEVKYVPVMHCALAWNGGEQSGAN